MEIDPALVIPDRTLSLDKGAIRPWARASTSDSFFRRLLTSVGETYGFSMHVPLAELTAEQLNVILYGSGSDVVTVQYTNRHGNQRAYDTTFEGVIPNLVRRHKETTSDWMRAEIERYMATRPCPECGGTRLNAQARAVTLVNKNISQVTKMSVVEALQWVKNLQHDGNTLLTARQRAIANQILKELHARLGFMADVGLDYLALDRAANSLSGGEAQRIRLATQIGSRLVGVLYILDEPSIGLHQRDNERLLRTLERMRDLGNTLVVVEHDAETIGAADWIVDLGPGAGEHGGEVVAVGPLETILATPESLTGQYLNGQLTIPIPEKRRPGKRQGTGREGGAGA